MTQVKNWVHGIYFLAKRTTVQLLLELNEKRILLPTLELIVTCKDGESVRSDLNMIA